MRIGRGASDSGWAKSEKICTSTNNFKQVTTESTLSVLVDKSSKLIKYEATVPINFAISSHPSTEKKQKSLSRWRCKLEIQRNTKIFAYRKEPTHYYFFSKDAFCLYSIKYFSIRHEKRLTELCQ